MRKVSVFYVLMVLIAGPAWSDEEAGSTANDGVAAMAVPAERFIPCEGNGCDAYLPVASHVLRYEDVKAQKRLNGSLGGLAGILIGEDVAGLPGAIAFGALGAATGWTESNTERWEEDQRAYEAGYLAGTDMFYDPSRRLPLNAHWMQAGPAREKKAK